MARQRLLGVVVNVGVGPRELVEHFFNVSARVLVEENSTGSLPHFGGWAPFPTTLVVVHVCLFGPRTSTPRVGRPLGMGYDASSRTASTTRALNGAASSVRVPASDP